MSMVICCEYFQTVKRPPRLSVAAGVNIKLIFLKHRIRKVGYVVQRIEQFGKILEIVFINF